MKMKFVSINSIDKYEEIEVEEHRFLRKPRTQKYLRDKPGMTWTNMETGESASTAISSVLWGFSRIHHYRRHTALLMLSKLDEDESEPDEDIKLPPDNPPVYVYPQTTSTGSGLLYNPHWTWTSHSTCETSSTLPTHNLSCIIS